MKNLLRVFLLSMIALTGYGQATPVTVTNGVIALKGKGKLGGNKDGYQYYQYNTPVSGSFYLQAYFKSLTNSSQAYSGIAFRNIGTYQRTDGGVASVMLVYQNDSLKCLIKSAYNQKAVAFLVSGNIKIPGHLKLVKEGNDAKFYYSNQAESDVTINFVSLGSVQNAFLGWSNITQNFITGGNTGVVQTALASKRVYGSLGSSPPNTVTAPTLASNPASPVSGSSVTFTASGCSGTVGFFQNNTAIVGSNPLTVGSPVFGDIYSAKCTVSGVSSEASNEFVIGSIEANQTTLPNVSKVYFQGGKKLYDANANVVSTPINPVLSGDYNFSETANRSCQSGRTLKYSFEEGNGIGYGWTNYPVNNIDLSAMHGKTILFKSACVGTAYNEVEDLHSTYVYLKRNATAPNRNINGLTYLAYANNFVPDFSRNVPSVFLNRIPSFTLNHKSNVYEGTMATNSVGLDLTNFGMKAWHLKRSATTTFSASRNYITDPDTPFGDVASNSSSTNPINSFSTSEMINRANQYSSYGQVGYLFSDDEHRMGRTYDNNGLKNMYDFFQQTKTLLPNTIQSAHHNYPIGWNVNNTTAQQDKDLFNNFYSSERAIHNARTPGLLGQYWDDIAGKNSGDNTGNTIFKAISVDAYTHFYNSPDAYKWAMLTAVNKKWYPNHKVLPTIEGWLELLGDYGNNSKETISWKTSNTTAERLSEFPPQSVSQFEQSAVIGNFLGDGINFWGNFLTVQDDRPNAYYANNSQLGTPSGFVNQAVANTYGVYLSQSNVGVDYLFLTLQKLSRISTTEYDWNNPIRYEMSIDNGVTWITGEETVYGISARNKRPIVFGIKSANGKFVICAMHPSNNSVAPYTFKVRYTGLPETTITVDGQFPQIIIYSSQATEGTSVIAPTITKDIANPTAGQSVTLTSSGCQSSSYVTKWYDSTEGNLILTSLTYTVNAVNGNGYYAKCVGASNSSVASNSIIFNIPVTPPSGGVTITEPVKSQYFYSNGQAPSFYNNRANLPAVITNNTTFDEADVVKLKNSDVEFWFNLRRGGQICYASKANTPINRVYNGYDGGFQWVFDGAQYLVDGVLNGVPPDQTNNNINYNTTMGGDFENHSHTLIDYHPVGTNGYYIKFRPILYNFISRVSEIEIEATYTLVGKSLKADYKYTSFRTDANIEVNNAFRFMGFHIPICFLTNNFTKYSAYIGTAPWTNGNMTEGDIPNITGGINQSFGLNSTEFTGIAFDPSNGFAVGVLNKIDNTNTQTSITYEQLNKYSDSSPGTVFTGPYTTMAVAESFAIPNGANFERSSSVYFTLGDSVQEVRNELKAKAGF